MKGKTICIDFDGVICSYSNGFQGEDVFGDMIPNADVATASLKERGWTVIIFTTRRKTPKLESWLKDHKIVYDHINENPDQPENTSGKIIADVYLDDRGVTFRGNWSWALNEILNFETWEECGRKEIENIRRYENDSIWDRGNEKRIRRLDM